MPSLSTNELDLRLVLPTRNIDDVVANYREMADEGGETANQKKERIRGYILRNDGVCSDVQSFLNMVYDEHGIVELSIMANDAFAASSMLTAVIANALTNAATLALIAARTATAADLVTILAHANHDAAVDTAVIANALTNAATLALIAARTATAADLVTISAHANHDAAVDTAVIANALTDAATLALIAARTATAADLVTILAHANHDAAVDTAVIANALTDAATLALIAARTGLVADLDAIAGHPNAAGIVGGEIDQARIRIASSRVMSGRSEAERALSQRDSVLMLPVADMRILQATASIMSTAQPISADARRVIDTLEPDAVSDLRGLRSNRY